MKKLAVILISLAVLVGRADAQDVVRRAGVQDLKWQVGDFYRKSRLTIGDSIQLSGFTPVNALSRGIDNYGLVACSDSLNALIVEVGEAGGGDIYLPPGTYRASAPITIEYDNVSLIGAGANSTVIFPTWDGNDALELDATNTVRIRHASNVTIHGIGVRAARCTGDCENSGFAIEGGFYNTISFCHADSCDNAGILVGYDRDGYFELAAADRVDYTSAAMDSIDGYGHMIIGNRITATHGGCGIEIMRSDSCIVSNNYVDGVQQYCLRVDASQGSIVSGNIFTGADDQAISIQGYGDAGSGIIKTVSGIVVDSNVLHGETGVSIFNGCDNVTISNNTIKMLDVNESTPCIVLDKYRETGTYGSLAFSWQNVSIVGNTIIGGKAGITIRGKGDGLLINDNSIGEWSDYGIQFDGDFAAGVVVENASVSGNRIWYKDRLPTQAGHKFMAFEGDSCCVSVGRNKMSAPAAADMSYYSFMYVSEADSVGAKTIRVSPVYVDDVGVIGNGSESDRKNLNQINADLWRLAGSDTTRANTIDLYFGGAQYIKPSGTIWDAWGSTRITGPSAPNWLRGGRPRQLFRFGNGGTPYDAVAAPPGSLCTWVHDDSTLWVKTGYGKSGWVLK